MYTINYKPFLNAESLRAMNGDAQATETICTMLKHAQQDHTEHSVQLELAVHHLGKVTS